MDNASRSFRILIVAMCLLLTGYPNSASAQKTGLAGDKLRLNSAGTGVQRGDSGEVEPVSPSILYLHLSVTHTTEMPTLRDIADIDGDGDMDLLGSSGEVLEWDDETLFWWENNGQLVFTEHIIATGQEINFAEAFDMDGDGDTDIVTYSGYPCLVFPCNPPSEDELFWWENDGSQNFTKASIIQETLRSTAYSPVLVDLDKDGDGDVVLYDADDDLAWVEHTTPGWVYHRIFYDVYDGGEHIVAGDFDGDNDVDIIMANDYTNPQYGWVLDRLDAWVNDGSMAFTQVRLDSNENRYTGNMGLEGVDFDMDGDLDLVSTNGDVEWWENQGSLQFVRHEISGNSTSGVHPGDLDGDGDMDVLHRHNDFWVYQENLGAGVFQRRSIALADPERTLTGDLDKDGRIDLLSYGFEGVPYFDLLVYAPATPAALPFYDGFDEPYLGSQWENKLSEDGEVYLQSDTVISGTQSLYFTDPTVELNLHLDLSGEQQVDLSFVLGNEVEPASEDGVYISENGSDWSLVVSRTLASTTAWTKFVVDLDEAAAAAGLAFNENFQVKFMLGEGVFWLDEVEVYAPGSNGAFKRIYLPAIVKQESSR